MFLLLNQQFLTGVATSIQFFRCQTNFLLSQFAIHIPSLSLGRLPLFSNLEFGEEILSIFLLLPFYQCIAESTDKQTKPQLNWSTKASFSWSVGGHLWHQNHFPSCCLTPVQNLEFCFSLK